MYVRWGRESVNNVLKMGGGGGHSAMEVEVLIVSISLSSIHEEIIPPLYSIKHRPGFLSRLFQANFRELVAALFGRSVVGYHQLTCQVRFSID